MIIKNKSRVAMGVLLSCVVSLLLSACTAYVQPIQPVPAGPRYQRAWVPGHYDRFGGWVRGHYR